MPPRCAAIPDTVSACSSSRQLADLNATDRLGGLDLSAAGGAAKIHVPILFIRGPERLGDVSDFCAVLDVRFHGSNQILDGGLRSASALDEINLKASCRPLRALAIHHGMQINGWSLIGHVRSISALRRQANLHHANRPMTSTALSCGAHRV